MDIKPGSKVTVEIKRPPTSHAARKTLTRVCAKDPQIAKADRRRKEKRPSLQEKRRGGRFWAHRMKSRSAVELTPGAKYHVLATLDVMRDLASVERFIAISG